MINSPCFKKIEIYEFMNLKEVTGSDAFIVRCWSVRTLFLGQELLGETAFKSSVRLFDELAKTKFVKKRVWQMRIY